MPGGAQQQVEDQERWALNRVQFSVSQTEKNYISGKGILSKPESQNNQTMGNARDEGTKFTQQSTFTISVYNSCTISKVFMELHTDIGNMTLVGAQLI